MKDFLNYYYFLYPDKIRMHNKNYYFSFKNRNFILYLYEFNLNEVNNIYSLNNYLTYNNYQTNKIILNKEMNILTKYNNKYYILIELIIDNQNIISLKNIINFNRRKLNLNILNRTNWYILWINKIDNIEYTMIHIKNKYKILYNSLFYYIGLTENAISYLKYFNLENNNIGLAHNRINIDGNISDLYNPINFVIDYKVRDIAEYYKSLFFYKKISYKEIIDSFKKIRMTNIDYIFFYIRLLYPSYYFDLYDSILRGYRKESDILEIVNSQNDYEYLLYEIYLVIKKQVNLVGISWINKKFIK